jgi:hypothetical protein
VALAASSDMCTQLSKAPIPFLQRQKTRSRIIRRDIAIPIVQIGLSQLSINAHPVGQVVKFAVCAKINLPSFLLCRLPIGSAIIVAKISTKFIIVKTVCSFPIIRLKLDAITPCMSTQPRKTA